MTYEIKLTSEEPERWWHKYLHIKRKMVEFKGVTISPSYPSEISFSPLKEFTIDNINIKEKKEKE